MLVCGVGRVEGSGYGIENGIGCIKGQGKVFLENNYTYKNGIKSITDNKLYDSTAFVLEC